MRTSSRCATLLILTTLGFALSAATAARAQISPLGAHVLDACDAPGDCVANESFGDALAVCDFDDDGFQDLAVGVPEETVGPNDNAGSLHIFYGSPAGLTSTGAQAFDLDDLDLSGGADAGDQLGRALAANDFDRDGICDLAAGAHGKSVGAPDNNAGAVVVFFGSVTGLRLDGFRFLSQNHLPAGSSESSEENDAFGAALAALPNGGLAIGVPSEDLGLTDTNEGRVHLLSSSGPGDALDSVVDRAQDNYLDVCPDGNEINDNWGTTLAVGRFGNSAALAVGAQWEGVGGTSNAGRVTISGSPDGCVDQNTSGVQDTAEPSDLFGAALAVGDFDDDGFEDLATGVPLEDLETTGDDDAGVVQIFYGSSTGLSVDGDQLWNQDHFSPDEAAEIGDELGSALASGDFDGDDFDDLAIGVPLENIGGASDVGKVNILYGDVQGLQLTGRQTFSSDVPSGMPETSESGDQFGGALAAGDFDGNGSDDLAIAMPGEDLGGAANAGAVTVAYGLDGANGAFGTVQFSDNAGSIPESLDHTILLVTRVGGAVLAASVEHLRSGGTATPGLDFTYNSGTESWNAGDLSPNFFAVFAEEDTLDEPNETIVFTLSDPSAGTAVGDPSTFTLTIVDNDVAGAISFVQPVTGFSELAGSVQVPVQRTLGAASGVTIQYTTSNASATAGLDYTSTTGTLTFAAGETTRFIPLEILDDGIAEGGEVFLVTLSNPGGGGVLGTFTVHQVVIIDNEIFLDGFELGNSSRWSAVAP